MSCAQLADRHRLLLVEDAAHAAGGVEQARDRPARAADAVAFSFYPTKPLAAGVTEARSPPTARTWPPQVRRLRSYGWSEWSGQAPSPGVNSRLDEIQAAVLRGRLAACRRPTSGCAIWAGSTAGG